MNILIIGGTRNLGHYLTHELLKAGHQVTVLNRGKTPDALPEMVERLRGDRNKEVEELAEALSGDAGRKVAVLSVPYTFPPDDLGSDGRMLSGLGVPDLRMTNSSYAYYGSDVKPVFLFVRAPRFTTSLGMRFNAAVSEDITLSGYGQWTHSATMLHQPASAPGGSGCGGQANHRPARLLPGACAARRSGTRPAGRAIPHR